MFYARAFLNSHCAALVLWSAVASRVCRNDVVLSTLDWAGGSPLFQANQNQQRTCLAWVIWGNRLIWGTLSHL